VWWRRRLSGKIAPTDICILISLVSEFKLGCVIDTNGQRRCAQGFKKYLDVLVRMPIPQIYLRF
jgi:hypothetical protein